MKLPGRYNCSFKSSVMLHPVVTEISKHGTAILWVNIAGRVNQTGLLDPELKSDRFRLKDYNCVPLDMSYVTILGSS